MNAPQYSAPPRSANWIAYPTLHTDTSPAVGSAAAPPAAAPPPSPPPSPSRPSPAQSRALEEALTCPITLDLMEDPVVATDGHTYDRAAISAWVDKEGRSPITNEPLLKATLRPNITVRRLLAAAALRATPEPAAVPPLPESVVADALRGPQAAMPAWDAPESCARVIPAWEPATPSAPPWPAPALDMDASSSGSLGCPSFPDSARPARPSPARSGDTPPSGSASLGRAPRPLAVRGAVSGHIAARPPLPVTPVAAPRAAATPSPAPGVRGTPERLNQLVGANDALYAEFEAIWTEYSHARHAFCRSGDAQRAVWIGQQQASAARAGAARGWLGRRAPQAEAKRLSERLAQLDGVLRDLRRHMTSSSSSKVSASGPGDFEACRQALVDVSARLQATGKQVCKQEAQSERQAEWLAKSLHKGPDRDLALARARKARGRIGAAEATLKQVNGSASKRC